MSASYEIVKYRPEFRYQVIDLQRHLWSPDSALNADYIAWKYEANPYTDEIDIYVAISDGKVVGMSGFMGAEWQIGTGGKRYPFYCTGDTVVDPAHRGQGLFGTIMAVAIKDLADRGYPFMFNMNASPITFLSALKSGWRLVEPYKSWQRQTRTVMLARKLRSWMRGKSLVWRYADGRIPLIERHEPAFFKRFGEMARASGLLFETLAKVDQMADLARRTTPDDGRLRHVMDETYITWRYRNPKSHYGFLYAGDGPLRGYLVLQSSVPGKAGDVAIVDWQADNDETLLTLISAVCESDIFQSLSIWTATLPDPLLAALIAHDFRPWDDTRGIGGYTPGILVRTTQADAGEHEWRFHGATLTDPESWDLRMIYSDYY